MQLTIQPASRTAFSFLDFNLTCTCIVYILDYNAYEVCVFCMLNTIVLAIKFEEVVGTRFSKKDIYEQINGMTRRIMSLLQVWYRLLKPMRLNASQIRRIHKHNVL